MEKKDKHAARASQSAHSSITICSPSFHHKCQCKMQPPKKENLLKKKTVKKSIQCKGKVYTQPVQSARAVLKHKSDTVMRYDTKLLPQALANPI